MLTTQGMSRRTNGIALASVMFLMLILFACGMSFFAFVRMSCTETTHRIRNARAAALARSGIEWFYSRAQLVSASTPGYTLPGAGVTTTLPLAAPFEPGESIVVLQLTGPPSNACVATGLIKDSAGNILASRRLALPSTVSPAMSHIYDPDSL